LDNCIRCHPDGRAHDGLAQSSQQYVSLFNWLDKLWAKHW
jgi:hypothetical protein